MLSQAIKNSAEVFTFWDSDQLVGLCRCLSDDATIMYLQDILVKPSHQRKGVGTRLMKEILQRFKHVRQIVLLTDDSPQQLAFYNALGLQNTKEYGIGNLNTFVRFL